MAEESGIALLVLIATPWEKLLTDTSSMVEKNRIFFIRIYFVLRRYFGA